MTVRSLTIAGAVIRVFPQARFLQVEFENGTAAPAAPSDDAGSWERARALGHDDLFIACVRHELSHCLVSKAMGKDVSPTLRGAALKRSGLGSYCKFWAFEEQCCFSLDSYAMTGQWKRWLEPLGFNTGTYLDCLGWHLGSSEAVTKLADELDRLAVEALE